MQKLSSLKVSQNDVFTNARIKYLPDDNGVYLPYEVTCFNKAIYKKSGWETNSKKSKIETESLSGTNSVENQRKSYSRAKNKLFDILMSTINFNCFVTLTFDDKKINRYDYNEVVKKLSVWLDNRVRRNNLVYCLVPEFHKDGAVHFHGLMNIEALKCERARNPHTNKLMYDKANRPIWNITDFPYGFTTAISLSGDDARIKCAKYCYKYITKTNGQKVGGRYYLSGGHLGRPRFDCANVVFEEIKSPEFSLGFGNIKYKKIKL